MNRLSNHRGLPCIGDGFARAVFRRGLCATVAALLLIIGASASACPIPVYQYALEWWERDPYEIYVFDNGTLSEDEQGALALLEGISNGSRRDEYPANLKLFHVRAEEEARLGAHSALRGATPESFPWMAVHYPAVARRLRAPVWMGPLTMENVKLLLDSPARQQISELLVNRVSTVWVLLESGMAREDTAAARMLEAEVKRLEKTLVPPDPSAWGQSDLHIEDIRFSTLRLSRHEPEEQMLVAMLLNSEIDLKDSNEPMVFAIFGRGLIMHALVGRGINPRMIRETAEFLTGPCSCTVKSMNPGTDMLTSTDWKTLVVPTTEQFTTQPGGLGVFLDSAGQLDQDRNEDK